MTSALLLLALAALAGAPFVTEALRPSVEGRRGAAAGDLVRLPLGITHVRRAGEGGRVAVLVHGLTTPSAVWEALVPHLVEMGYRVISYDLPGRGLSDRVPGRQDRAFFLRHLREVMAAEGAQRATLVGYSMGGSIVTAFAAGEPQRVDRLILLAPAGLGHDLGRFGRVAAGVRGLGDWAMIGFGGWLMRRDLRGMLDRPTCVPGFYARQIEETRVKGFLPAVLSSQRHMLSEDLEAEHRTVAGLGIPVLAIWGGEDGVILPVAQGRLAQANRAARQEVVEGAGHGLPHTHAPQVAEAIRAALAADQAGTA